MTIIRRVFTLSGAVTDGTSGGILPKINIQIMDGADAGKSTATDSSGRYSISSVGNGTFTVSAFATSYVTTTKSVTVSGDTRLDFVLPRTTPVPTPPTTPSPSPTPSPVPGGSTVLHIFGGPPVQYLGILDCVNCTSFNSDSVNNQFGPYGSQFSSTSIRNQFSQFGSQFSSLSECNQFASSPPIVVDGAGRYVGELTLNQFRPNAIRNSVIVGWLQFDVCRH